nr:MAG TPA: hypothetical protein [Caudoviricetes sp.]
MKQKRPPRCYQHQDGQPQQAPVTTQRPLTAPLLYHGAAEQ